MKIKFRDILAGVFVLFVMAMFSLIVWKQLGGNEALFLIIGHTAAWAEMIFLFFFRKKPRGEEVS